MKENYVNRIEGIIKRNKEIEKSGIARLSLLQGEILHMINKAQTLDEVKEIQSAYKLVTDNVPI